MRVYTLNTNESLDSYIVHNKIFAYHENLHPNLNTPRESVYTVYTAASLKKMRANGQDHYFLLPEELEPCDAEVASRPGQKAPIDACYALVQVVAPARRHDDLARNPRKDVTYNRPESLISNSNRSSVFLLKGGDWLIYKDTIYVWRPDLQYFGPQDGSARFNDVLHAGEGTFIRDPDEPETGPA